MADAFKDRHPGGNDNEPSHGSAGPGPGNWMTGAELDAFVENDRKKMAEVPNRAKDPKRSPVNFYNAQGEYSHTADVRWNGARGYTSSRPHAGDIKKNMPSMGGWSVPELDNNPNAPEQGKK